MGIPNDVDPRKASNHSLLTNMGIENWIFRYHMTSHSVNKGEIFHQITNISRQKVSNIFINVNDALLKIFSKGRGQRYLIAPGNMLFVLLKTLESSSSLQFCSTQFRIPIKTFKRLLWSVLVTVSDDLQDHAGVAVEVKKPKLSFWKRKIVNFYIIRMLYKPLMCFSSSQQDHLAPVTTANTDTAKKHEMYGLKTEVSLISMERCKMNSKHERETFLISLFFVKPYPGTGQRCLRLRMTWLLAFHFFLLFMCH